MQLEQFKANLMAQSQERAAMMARETAVEVAKINAWGKVASAEATAKSALSAAQSAAAQDGGEGAAEAEPELGPDGQPVPPPPSVHEVLANAMQTLAQAVGELRRPRSIVRGPDGRAQGIA